MIENSGAACSYKGCTKTLIYAKGLCKTHYRNYRHHVDPAQRKKHLATMARWRKENPERFKLSMRRWNVEKKYGLALGEYEKILASQGGVCAICGRPPTGKSLCIDHDHKTGFVRGLLCFHCNYGLTWFKDYPERLVVASGYLKRPPARRVIGDRIVPGVWARKYNPLMRRKRKHAAEPVVLPETSGNDTSDAPTCNPD